MRADASTDRFEGYWLMSLPLSTGHVLAFRQYTASTIGPPFTSVWHRDPAGRWTFHVNVMPNRSCPRYFGPALHDVRVGAIDVVWKSRTELSVYAQLPRLHIALRVGASSATRLVSSVTRLLPPALWRHDAPLRLIGRGAGRALGADALALNGRAPGGQWFRQQPRSLWRVEAAAVVRDGRDLGELSVLTERVALADFALPRCALFASGATAFTADRDAP